MINTQTMYQLFVLNAVASTLLKWLRFPWLRYLWNQHFYIINVRRHFDWNTGCFCAIETRRKRSRRKTHKQSSYNNAIRLCFATHIRISLRRQQLPSRCICSTCCLIRRPCSKSTLILFVGALVVRNALDIAGSHENRGKYSHDSISQFTRSSSPATSSSAPSTKQQQPHHEWMNELHRKSQQLCSVAIVLASCIL